MPSVTYSGVFVDSDGDTGLNAGTNGRSIAVSGESIPAGMTITGILYTLAMSASSYDVDDTWDLHWFAIGSKDGSPAAPAKSFPMTSYRQTLNGEMNYTQADIEKFATGSFMLYAKANTTFNATSYMREFTITVNYEEYSKCGAPTACNVSSALATSNVTLSWSGATAGYGNAITGYEVQRCESSDGKTWGSWTALTTTTATSLSVAPPTTAGNYYKYRVRTQGAAGASYYSGWKESTNTLRRNWTACGAPTACALSSTLATGNVTLSWSGATAGYGNAISGYAVYCADSADGINWNNWTMCAATDSYTTSCVVSPPSVAGYYRKFMVYTIGAIEGYNSPGKESSNTLRRDHAPLAGFADATLTPGATPVKALHMQELQDRVATLRAFYGLSAYPFTPIVSGQTSLAGWTAHVLEIRAAVDGIGKSHETWLTITENKPRADVIQQLRKVVLAL